MLVVCFFIFGILIGLVDKDFRFSSAARFGIGCYILMAIGLQGGVSLREVTDLQQAIYAILAALAIAVVVPLYLFPLSRPIFGKLTGAAVAASYACFSPTTYAVALHFLQAHHQSANGFMAAAMAVGEPLGIAVVLMMLGSKELSTSQNKLPNFIAPFLLGPCLLLIISLIAGLIAGGDPLIIHAIEPYSKSLFMGGLCLFVLAEGLEISSQVKLIFSHGIKVLIFAIFVPLSGAVLGAVVAYFMKLPASVAFLLIVLCASANYTTVPATFRSKLPKADPAIYVTMALCITFTFNVLAGLPLYWYCVKALGL